MTVDELVATVLAFVREHGPIGAVAYLMGGLAATLVVFYFVVKVTGRFIGRKSFQIGGHFDHFYSRMLRAARHGAVALIYAGYVALWLSKWPVASRQFPLLHDPYNSGFYGVLATLTVAGLVAWGSWELVKAEWSALRWLRLEARGVLWHITDSGDPYRVVWLRRNGEYWYEKNATRDERAYEELTKLRERRIRLFKLSVIAAIAVIVWLRGQTIIESFYPVISIGFVSFLHSVLPISILLVFSFVAIPVTVGVVSTLVDKLIYLSGAQFITGAKVLEPGAWRLGRQNVEDQKAHGDAAFETAEEAVRRMIRPGAS